MRLLRNFSVGNSRLDRFFFCDFLLSRLCEQHRLFLSALVGFFGDHGFRMHPGAQGGDDFFFCFGAGLYRLAQFCFQFLARLSFAPGQGLGSNTCFGFLGGDCIGFNSRLGSQSGAGFHPGARFSCHACFGLAFEPLPGFMDGNVFGIQSRWMIVVRWELMASLFR